jgi:hypothetical protein
VHLERARGGGIAEEGGAIEPKKGHKFLCEGHDFMCKGGHDFLCKEGHKFRGVNSSIEQAVQYGFCTVLYSTILIFWHANRGESLLIKIHTVRT